MHKMRRKGRSKDFSAEESPETGVTLTNLRAAGKRICASGVYLPFPILMQMPSFTTLAAQIQTIRWTLLVETGAP